MPKQCKAEACNNPQFGGGYCSRHQHKREPKTKSTQSRKERATGIVETKHDKDADREFALLTADKAFSLYIRMRDADKNSDAVCCTCGRKFQAMSMDAGHWISRKHMGTRFDESNVHAQCIPCNRLYDGMDSHHEEYIRERYGANETTRLMKAAKLVTKYSYDDLVALKQEFVNKLKAILNDKS